MTTVSMQPVALEQPQIDDAGAVLARAFFDDPMMAYIMPDEAQRGRVLPWFMRASTLYAHRYGEAYTTPGAVEANALWLPPGDTTMTLPRMVRCGLIQAPFRMGMGGFSRFNRVVSTIEKLHKRDMPEPHWYLFVLGVDPPRQGQGVGSALIGPRLAEADAAGLPCYLETSKERNVPFYKRHGFEVIVEGTIEGENGFRYWTMRRPARA